MQPEANIDVWGSPNSNQVDVVKRIANNLNDDAKLYIKPNPKSKYEISEELISLIKNNEKIEAISHSSIMSDLLNDISLIISVTGTISIECIFSNKPIAVFGKGLQFDQKNCVSIKTDHCINDIICDVKNGLFPKLTLSEKIDYLNLLIKSSFKGVLGDGYMNRNNLYNKENMKSVLNAFNQIVYNFENEKV